MKTRSRRTVPARWLVLAGLVCWPSGAHGEPEWARAEAGMLRDHVQLTFPERFSKAGEAYFSPDGEWVIFQAVPAVREGEEPEGVYSMFVAMVEEDERGGVTGLGEALLVSPPGSANTCGFFHPIERGWIIFGSTLTPPGGSAPAGYQRGTSSYAWQFPSEMEVVTRVVPMVFHGGAAHLTGDMPWPEGATDARPLWVRDGYDAECAYSPDGRFIVYTAVDPETLDPDLFVFDTRTGRHTALVQEKGYDGGPFFSPDGRYICYRSDRRGNDLLQVFIAELSFDEEGGITGVSREMQVTDNEHVNWAPFWHPSGRYLAYTTSEQGHRNYEVYTVEVPLRGREGAGPGELRRRRITHAPGFDGLPVFSRDGSLMMWTSQRGRKLAHEDRPSSQLWVARVVDVAP